MIDRQKFKAVNISEDDLKHPDLIYTSPNKPGIPATLILAHGAGAPADSSFMNLLSDALADRGVATVRFEFPYMAKRRQDGRKRPPDRQPVLLSHFRDVIADVQAQTGDAVFIGGKSMGGRMASLLVSEESVSISGCCCFGYPFHAPGRKDRWRTEHFQSLQCPVRVIQGTRDTFGRREDVEVQPFATRDNPRIAWLEGGNHDFKPLAKQPETQEDLIARAAQVTEAFIRDELSFSQ